MAEVDSLRRFLFEGLQVRGELVRLDAAWQRVLEYQDYPPAVRAVLGEALAATVLLASTLKFEGMLTLQLQGDGPMHLLVAQCTSQGAVRGLAKWEGEAPTGGLLELTQELARMDQMLIEQMMLLLAGFHAEGALAEGVEVAEATMLIFSGFVLQLFIFIGFEDLPNSDLYVQVDRQIELAFAGLNRESESE